MEKKLPVSVCMISGAEAHRIRRALESVAPWVSEIIVVLNPEVSDGTEQVAAGFGGKVFCEPWKGFLAQKNSAADKATQPWLLGLDADEVVSPALRAEIENVLRQSPPGGHCEAYSFPRCTLFCGRWIRHGDWYPDRQIRLWQKGRARWGGIDPHARLAVRGRVGRLHHDLLHYSMESFEHQIAKTITYADDFVRHCAANHRRIGLADLLVRPAWRFARGYVIKRGFLDGWQGCSIAWMAAFYTFLRYAKARAAQEDPQP